MYEFFPGHYRWSYVTLLAFAAGGQLGDIALIVPKLRKKVGDEATWFDAWSWLAEILDRRAQNSGSDATRCEAYFLAALYHNIAEFMVSPPDGRREKGYAEMLRCFGLAMQDTSLAISRVAVPYEGQSLPGYFLSAGGPQDKAPTAIFICGLDTTKELWFLRARDVFTQRGVSCLFIDTPGIGEALRYQNLYTMAEYERPVGAAVDYLLSRPDVDASRIGLIGSSLGGYYVARAAAFETRIRATVAWGAINDYHQTWVNRITAAATATAPTSQLMFITGMSSIEDAVAAISEFKVKLFAHRIKAPFLIVHGSDDRQVPVQDAAAMLAALGSEDKELKIFSGEDGGSAHTQFDNHLPAIHFVADWISKKLASRVVVTR